MKNRNLWINLLIGMGLLSVPILTSPDFGSFQNMAKAPGFQRSVLAYSLLFAFFYLNYHVLIPKFYSKKKRWIYAALLLACFLVVSYTPDLIINSPKPPSNLPFPNNPPHKTAPIDLFGFRDTFIIQFSMIAFLSILLRLDHRLNTIQNEKLKAEVNYLKAQINPHFLFNTLNSVYALTLKKSDEAPWAVLKLSEMMRYVVTESHAEKVSLEREIQYITDYIDLQKLRMGNHTNLVYEIQGNPSGQKIAPIILINYVENAFKYGVNPDELSNIRIFIHIESHSVELIVENKITVKNTSFKEPTTEGNKNTKKRLDYFYPEKYQLHIDQRDNFYMVNLLIDLS
ncbi:sensor histidine kinase [Flagellimonas olearia]|nr:sensor histidine kinase [Allomuricauda olearia]